ncbi:hypothetical protein ACFXKI_00950 [Streptomyces mirabilis]|uniref:hypothetical protein n=1 Tax=Streptomyces mirabilis TaxID=68239 RepID=UPI003675FE89
MPENATTEPTHHYILTLQAQGRSGSVDVVTFSAAVTPPAGWTRHQFYKGLYAELTAKYEHLVGANTLFFLLAPNQL